MKSIIVLGLLCLVACNPVYKTKYRYDTTFANSSCIDGCKTKVTMCEQEQDRLYLTCEQVAVAEYSACISQPPNCVYIGAYPSCTRPTCFRDSCKKNYDSCVELMNTCVASCGGKVIPYDECIRYCEQ